MTAPERLGSFLHAALADALDMTEEQLRERLDAALREDVKV